MSDGGSAWLRLLLASDMCCTGRQVELLTATGNPSTFRVYEVFRNHTANNTFHNKWTHVEISNFSFVQFLKLSPLFSHHVTLLLIGAVKSWTLQISPLLRETLLMNTEKQPYNVSDHWPAHGDSERKFHIPHLKDAKFNSFSSCLLLFPLSLSLSASARRAGKDFSHSRTMW